MAPACLVDKTKGAVTGAHLTRPKRIRICFSTSPNRCDARRTAKPIRHYPTPIRHMGASTKKRFDPRQIFNRHHPTHLCGISCQNLPEAGAVVATSVLHGHAVLRTNAPTSQRDRINVLAGAHSKTATAQLPPPLRAVCGQELDDVVLHIGQPELTGRKACQHRAEMGAMKCHQGRCIMPSWPGRGGTCRGIRCSARSSRHHSEKDPDCPMSPNCEERVLEHCVMMENASC